VCSPYTGEEISRDSPYN